MKKLVFLIAIVLCGCLNAFAQIKSRTIDNQTPGRLSSQFTQTERNEVEELSITGYINITDMSFVNSLIKIYNLKVLDLSNVTTITNGNEHYLWNNFLSFGSEKILQKVRLPLIVKGVTTTSNNGSGTIVCSKVDTLEIGWEDLSVIDNVSIWNTHAQHLILLDGVKNIPYRYFMIQSDDDAYYHSLWYVDYRVTLPKTITNIGGCAFGRPAMFNEPFIFPDSAEYIGQHPLIYDSYYHNYGYAIHNCWCERKPMISDKKFSFPLNMRFYNSLDYELNTAGGTRRIFTVDEFVSDTIVVHDKCDTLFAKINAKVAYFYNPKPITFWSFEDIKVDTLYVPEGCISAYLNDYNYAECLRPESGIQVKSIKEMKSVKGIDIISDKRIVYVGDEFVITTQIIPSDATEQSVYWESSNPEIVKSVDGSLKAIAYGTAVITATTVDGGYKDSITITVYEHTTGIDMVDKISIPINNTYTLNAKTLPLSTSDEKITYSSGNEEIATVNSQGVVNAKKKGTCTITATSVDGGFTATCEVIVTQPVEALTMEKHSITLKVGESERLYAQISPATANDKTISWNSSNDEIALVDENGNVTAKKAGEAWINAISNDNSEAKDSCIVTVSQPVTGIQLDNTTYFLNGIGKSFELKATVVPDDASNKNIKWKSSDESVCVVSQGLVVAVGLGTCVIITTTEDGGYMATCTVTVNKTTDISIASSQNNNKFQVYDANGSKRNSLQQGVNIIRFVDGTKKKVIIR